MSNGWFGEIAEVSRAKRPSRSALLRRDFWVRGRENSQKPIGWVPEKSKFQNQWEKTSIGYPDYTYYIPKYGWVKAEHDQFCCFGSFLDLIYHNDPCFTDSCLPSCFKPRHQNPSAGGNISQNLYQWCNKTMVKTIVSSSFRTYSPQKPLIKHHQKTRKWPAKAQLVRGLCYLNSRGLVHARLDSTTVIFQAPGTSLGCGLQGNGFSRVHETRGFYSRTMAIFRYCIYIYMYI